MVSLTLLSTVLMGLLVVVTAIAVARLGIRREPPTRETGDSYEATVDRLSSLSKSPAVWTVTFVVAALAVGLLPILAVGRFGVSEALSATFFNVVYAIIGLLIAVFVFVSAYAGTRQRGLGNAQGVVVGSLALGMLFLLLVAVQLVVGVVG